MITGDKGAIVETIDCIWITAASPDMKKLPEWARSVAIEKTGGECFFPAAWIGDEMSIMLCVSFDDVRYFHDKKHLYIPLSWAIREYPQHAKMLTEVIERAKGYLTD
jgi:hypothetical protein